MTVQEGLDFVHNFVSPRAHQTLQKELEDILAYKLEDVPEITGTLKKIICSLKAVPKLNATDGQGDQARARLHYTGQDLDVYLTELEMDTQEGFGLTIKKNESELGYISLEEVLNDFKLELDVHFNTKQTIADLKRKHQTDQNKNQINLLTILRAATKSGARKLPYASTTCAAKPKNPSPNSTSVSYAKAATAKTEEKADKLTFFPNLPQDDTEKPFVEDIFRPILEQNLEVIRRWAVKVLAPQAENQQTYLLQYDPKKQKLIIDLKFSHEIESDDHTLLLIDKLPKAQGENISPIDLQTCMQNTAQKLFSILQHS
ncbi:MAG: hypothetical protein IJS50_06125 [Desulfovibrio sp.]|nr:hypothetical protein [Desulfovibrio sp.]